MSVIPWQRLGELSLACFKISFIVKHTAKERHNLVLGEIERDASAAVLVRTKQDHYKLRLTHRSERYVK